MSLAPFSIIVAVDSANGIAKNGEIPWSSKEDTKFFRDTTLGKRKNAVIMGRVTYESIPEEHRPLEGRRCVVVSRTWKQEDHSDIMVFPSLTDALAGVGASLTSYEEVFIIGGEQIYNEAVRDFLYLCKKIYVTKFKQDYSCNLFFPFDEIKNYPLAGDPVKTRDYNRFVFIPKVEHDEYQYLNILSEIASNGEQKSDRTGVGTKSLFGVRMAFDITDRIPILTTKRLFLDSVIKELIFFISGKTDTKILEEQKVNIWKKNTSKEFLKERGLSLNEGDMGPGYGFQWRHWGAPYEGCEKEKYEGIDQLKNLIEGIRKEPLSRRHILSSWNVSQIAEMALPPCHLLAQFNISADKRYIDCQVYQRSGDFFLGIPFNIASYSLLTYAIGHICGLRPRKLILIVGDAHVYNNHGEQVKRQLNRTPRPFPKLSLREATRLHEIDDFTVNSFIVENYSSWPAITAEMAV